MSIYKKLTIRLGALSVLVVAFTLAAPSARAVDQACILACVHAATACTHRCPIPDVDEGCLEACNVELIDCESGC